MCACARLRIAYAYSTLHVFIPHADGCIRVSSIQYTYIVYKTHSLDTSVFCIFSETELNGKFACVHVNNGVVFVRFNTMQQTSGVFTLPNQIMDMIIRPFYLFTESIHYVVIQSIRKLLFI